MATVRIYKVAELLNTTSQEVIALLKRDHGIEVKSASSTIEEVVAREFVGRMARQRGLNVPSNASFADSPAPVKGRKPGGKAQEPVKPVAPALPPPRLVKSAKPIAPPPEIIEAPAPEAVLVPAPLPPVIEEPVAEAEPLSEISATPSAAPQPTAEAEPEIAAQAPETPAEPAMAAAPAAAAARRHVQWWSRRQAAWCLRCGN